MTIEELIELSTNQEAARALHDDELTVEEFKQALIDNKLIDEATLKNTGRYQKQALFLMQ